jgi:hypothetical protein
MESTEEESKAQPADAQLTHTLNVQPADAQLTHTLNVRRVPHQVWTRARVNATLSNLAFRDYVIRLLEQSTPLIAESLSQDQKRTG